MNAAIAAPIRATETLGRLLPERRIEIHGNDTVRLRLGTGAQLMGLATTALIAGWLGVTTMSNIGATDPRDAELARMQAQISAMKADSAALHGSVATTAERLEARQRFLAGLLTGQAAPADLAAMLPKVSGAARIEPTEALRPFAELEAKQLQFVDRAAATAEARARDAQAVFSRLGLDSARFVAQSTFRYAGVGGPYVPAETGVAAGADPRFTELYVNWQRVQQLEGALRSLPVTVPTSNFTYTSGFGFRYDPFNGGGASHTGVDMAGSHGEPIRASAGGRVVRAGWFAGYGNCIDIDHGRGIVTRYGHLSGVDVAVGDSVQAGQHIGEMGSTGRSTGTHLHFEVRIDGRAVNPKPFLEASAYVAALQRPAAQMASTGGMGTAR